MRRLSERVVKREIETEKEMKRIQMENKNLREQNEKLQDALLACRGHLEALEHLDGPNAKLHVGLKSRITQILEEVEGEIS